MLKLLVTVIATVLLVFASILMAAVILWALAHMILYIGRAIDSFLFFTRTTQHRRPVISVCEDQGRVGLCSRRDFDRESRRHSDEQDEIDAKGGMVGNMVSRTLRPIHLVLLKGSPELEEVLSGCWVEFRTFHVGDYPRESPTSGRQALEYLINTQ